MLSRKVALTVTLGVLSLASPAASGPLSGSERAQLHCDDRGVTSTRAPTREALIKAARLDEPAARARRFQRWICGDVEGTLNAALRLSPALAASIGGEPQKPEVADALRAACDLPWGLIETRWAAAWASGNTIDSFSAQCRARRAEIDVLAVRVLGLDPDTLTRSTFQVVGPDQASETELIRRSKGLVRRDGSCLVFLGGKKMYCDGSIGGEGYTTHRLVESVPEASAFIIFADDHFEGRGYVLILAASEEEIELGPTRPAWSPGHRWMALYDGDAEGPTASQPRAEIWGCDRDGCRRQFDVLDAMHMNEIRGSSATWTGPNAVRFGFGGVEPRTSVHCEYGRKGWKCR